MHSIYTPLGQQQALEALKQGLTWCCSCQQVNVTHPAFKQCLDCFRKKLAFNFCKKCGDHLEMKRVEYARRRGGTCYLCYAHSEKAPEYADSDACPECGFFHPHFFKHEQL